MFRREIYRTMARVLDAFDADVLAQTSFRFGGGTCLALAHGEYRVSRDIDFVCSDPGGYAELRRWADRDELARDLVDLAVLRIAHGPIPEAAWAAAEGAYRAAPQQDLRKAAERFLAEPDYQRRCFTGLDVEGADDVLRGVRALLSDLAGAP